MWTATIREKTTLNDGRIQVRVDFTDGIKIVTETIIPQDKNGFYHWLNGRLNSLNTSVDLGGELVVNNPVVVPTKPAPTQEEIDKTNWFRDWARLRAANELIAAGVITGNETAYTTLKQRVISNFRAVYINDM